MGAPVLEGTKADAQYLFCLKGQSPCHRTAAQWAHLLRTNIWHLLLFSGLEP